MDKPKDECEWNPEPQEDELSFNFMVLIRQPLTAEELAAILAQMVDGPPVPPTTGTFRREEMYG
jgi:hypothetical protein